MSPSSTSILTNKLFIGAITVVALSLAAGIGYYAYTQYLYYQPEAILKRVLTNTQVIISGSGAATLEVSATGPNVLSLVSPELSQGSTITSYALELDTTAIFDNEEEKWSYTFDGSADLDGQGVQAAGEFRNIEGRSYVRPINIPYFAFFYEVLEDRWIDLSDQVGEETVGYSVPTVTLTEEQIDELFQWILTEEFITISNVSTETVDSIEMIAVDYQVDHEKIPQFFRLYSEMISMNAGVGEPAYVEADHEEAEELIEMVTKEIDSIDGTALIESQNSIVYDSTVAIDVGDITQYEISDLQISISNQIRDVNQPVIVEVPPDALTFDEAAEIIEEAAAESIEDESGLDPDEIPSEAELPPGVEFPPGAELPSELAITPGM